jgi:hypothetical protein
MLETKQQRHSQERKKICSSQIGTLKWQILNAPTLPSKHLLQQPALSKTYLLAQPYRPLALKVK